MPTAAPEPAVLFHEIQRPRWTLGLAIATGGWVVAFGFFVLRTDRPLYLFDVLQALIMLCALVASLSRLRTVVQGETLELERRWGARHEVDLARIRSARTSTYYPRIDGGWGVRNGRGVILTRDDGNVLYVGSARAEELCEAIRGRLPAASAA